MTVEKWLEHSKPFQIVTKNISNKQPNQPNSEKKKKKKKNSLTVDAANKVYQSLVLPVMDYCDVAWSSIGKIERDKLDRAQRRAARIVLKTKDSDAEKNLKWLPLSMRRDMHTINLTFKCLKGSPPMFFKDYFKVFRTIHNTKESGNF